MHLRNNEPDAAFILKELTNSIRDRSDDVDLYLREGFMPISEPMPDRFWETLGIHRLMFNSNHNKPAITDHWNTGSGNDNNVLNSWNRIKNDSIAEWLRAILSDCSIIEFADWTAVDDVSGFWDRLYCDVIKPLNKRDFQFIFHLRNTIKKPVFEVDEILDILGDYSSYGTVTLVLHEDEADMLWRRLNGQNSGDFKSGFGSQETREKYLFLYNTIRIDVLLILHNNHAMVFSRDWQFDLVGGSLDSIHESLYALDSFTAGYQLGLLLQLQIPHCIALGMAVSVVCKEYTSEHGSKALLAYMQDWMTELHPAKTLN